MTAMARVQEGTAVGVRDVRSRKGSAGTSLAAFRVRADVEYSRSLSQLIEGEIIPRLLVAHSSDQKTMSVSAGDATISAAEVEVFAPLSLQVEADELIDYVEAIRRRGVSIETLLVDLLAPAARLLGEFWEDDRCDFVDVTMGLWRLQEVVYELCDREPVDHTAGPGHRALFASMPGDQHSFGTIVIDELFSREGWRTDRMAEATTPDLIDRVANDWFDLVGLTVSCDCHIAPLPAIIRAVRDVSRNPDVRVMVGGRIFAENASLAVEVGADGTARDAKLALKVAGVLVAGSAREAVL